MAVSVQGFQHLVSDGAWNHVDNEIGLSVIGCQSVSKMERSWRFARYNIVEMNIQSGFVKVSYNERADQSSAQTVNPHGQGLGHRASKVPAPHSAASIGEEVVMCYEVEREP